MQSLRSGGELSRADISRLVSLQKPSVSAIVAELLEHRLIDEHGPGETAAGGGRKPILLSLHSGAHCMLGIELQPRIYRLSVMDLTGRIRFETEGKIINSESDFEALFTRIVQESIEDIRAAGLKPIAAAVAMPGYIDSRNGYVHYSVPHDLKNADLSALLQQFDIPVLIENDANAAAWGELEYGKSRGETRDFLFLLGEFQGRNQRAHSAGGYSIGFGVVINGEIHAGTRFAAGDFTSVNWRYPSECQVGLTPAEMARVHTDESVQRAFVREILENLSVVLSILDPAAVFMGGDTELFERLVPELLSGELADRFVGRAEWQNLFQVGTYGKRAVASGAAAMLVELMFRPPTPNTDDRTTAIDWEMLISPGGQ
jgi:predicted NBD/HSP70 family sugar kinase